MMCVMADVPLRISIRNMPSLSLAAAASAGLKAAANELVGTAERLLQPWKPYRPSNEFRRCERYLETEGNPDDVQQMKEILLGVLTPGAVIVGS